jgi:hypothetical protein
MNDEILAKIGPEPDVSDYTDLHRWDKWMAWHRRLANLYPESNGKIDDRGFVIYNIKGRP